MNINVTALKSFTDTFVNPNAEATNIDLRAVLDEGDAKASLTDRCPTSAVSRAFARTFGHAGSDNQEIRRISQKFYQSVRDIFGGDELIPENIRTALGVHAHGGDIRPLSLRRIRIVSEALEGMADVKAVREQERKQAQERARVAELVRRWNAGDAWDFTEKDLDDVAGYSEEMRVKIENYREAIAFVTGGTEEDDQEVKSADEQPKEEPKKEEKVEEKVELPKDDEVSFEEHERKLNLAQNDFRAALLRKLGADEKLVEAVASGEKSCCDNDITTVVRKLVNGDKGMRKLFDEQYKEDLKALEGPAKAALEQWYANTIVTSKGEKIVSDVFEPLVLQIVGMLENPLEAAGYVKGGGLVLGDPADAIKGVDAKRLVTDLQNDALRGLNSVFTKLRNYPENADYVKAKAELEKQIAGALDKLGIQADEREAFKGHIESARDRILAPKLLSIVEGTFVGVNFTEMEGEAAAEIEKTIRQARIEKGEQLKTRFGEQLRAHVAAKFDGLRFEGVTDLVKSIGQGDQDASLTRAAFERDQLEKLVKGLPQLTREAVMKTAEPKIEKCVQDMLEALQPKINEYIANGEFDEQGFDVSRFDGEFRAAVLSYINGVRNDTAFMAPDGVIRSAPDVLKENARGVLSEREKAYTAGHAQSIKDLAGAIVQDKGFRAVFQDRLGVTAIHWLDEKALKNINDALQTAMSARMLKDAASVYRLTGKDVFDAKSVRSGYEFLMDTLNKEVALHLNTLYTRLVEDKLDKRLLTSDRNYVNSEDDKKHLAVLLQNALMSIVSTVVTNLGKYTSVDNCRPTYFGKDGDEALHGLVRNAVERIVSDETISGLLPSKSAAREKLLHVI